jgi:hypothetical protein
MGFMFEYNMFFTMNKHVNIDLNEGSTGKS